MLTGLTPSENQLFDRFTDQLSDDTIPYRLLVTVTVDPTMRLNLPPVDDLDLTPVERPPAQQPVIVYLSSLSVSSRRPQAGALAVIATILTGGRCSALQLPWHQLRFVHTNAVRAT